MPRITDKKRKVSNEDQRENLVIKGEVIPKRDQDDQEKRADANKSNVNMLKPSARKVFHFHFGAVTSFSLQRLFYFHLKPISETKYSMHRS